MRELNVRFAKFKLAVEHINYDAQCKLDDLSYSIKMSFDDLMPKEPVVKLDLNQTFFEQAMADRQRGLAQAQGQMNQSNQGLAGLQQDSLSGLIGGLGASFTGEATVDGNQNFTFHRGNLAISSGK